MPEYIVRDFPHYTVSVLLSAIRQKADPATVRDSAFAALRSSYNHLFISDYADPDEATGLAMSQLILVMGDHRRA